MIKDIDIERIKEGNSEEWERYFPELWKYLHGTALKSRLYVQGDDMDQYCEDLVSDALEKGIKNLSNCHADSPEQLLGYFTRIMFNEAYMKFRRRKNKTIHDRPDNWETIDLIIDNEGEVMAMFSELLKEIKQLPKNQQIALWMYGYEGYRHREIAEKLGLSKSTITERITIARKKVIEKLSA